MNLYVQKEIFWIIAGAWSLYFGLYAFKIHPLSEPKKNGECFNGHYAWTQIFLNGIGSLLGWIAFYFLLKLNWNDASKFGLQHLILSYVAFVGITGNLPFVSKFFKN